MAYTTPVTYAVGQKLTAANLNTYVRDNLRYFKGLDGAVSISDQIAVSATFGVSALKATPNGVSGVSSFWTCGEPGVSYDAAFFGLNWRATGGASMGRDDASKGGAYIRFTPANIAFDLVSSGGTDTRAMTITNGGMALGAYGVSTTPPSNGMIVSGSVGIGNSNPLSALAVGGTATIANNLGIGTSTPLATGTGYLAVSAQVYIGSATTYGGYQLQLSNDSAAKPSTNTWTVASDARLKTDVRPYTDGLDMLRALRPVHYRYNGKGGMPADAEGVGFIAQEVQRVVPSMVSSYWAKLNPDDTEDTDLLTVNTHELSFLLLNAIIEMDRRLATLEAGRH